MQDIRRAIRAGRAAKDQRQVDLAKSAGVPLWQIAALEAGYEFPARAIVLKRVSRALGIRLEQIEATKG